MKRKELKKPILWGTLFFILLNLSGCSLLQTLPERESEVKPQIAKAYRFEDIPLPPGMSLIRRESFIYETKATRTGILIYEGKGEMDHLSTFFKEEMPKHQWRLLSNFELHNVMLTFIKEGWSSVIYILPKEDETKRVEIRVGPIEIKIQPSL
ncbi:MAG: hypothetical protein ACUVTN_02130 [Thermodesulfobacteriota bacterium]